MHNTANWIKSPENKEEACYEFYIDFPVRKDIKNAVLNITAMGMYRAFLNGERIGDEVFTPYWTEYNKHIQYQSYDVKKLLKKQTTLTVVCAEGWAVGYLLPGIKKTKHYADNISLCFSLDIEYNDGEREHIVSNEKVKVCTSKIVSSSIYHGEYVNKTIPIRELGFALIDESIKTKIIPQIGEKVIEQDVIYPSELIITPKGEQVIDFGQNLAGYVEISCSGNRGEIIEISHAETLDMDGNFYTENLRKAKAKNTYVLSGEGEEVFKPTFTWQGFRYIRLDKFPAESIDLSKFRAIAVYSEMERTGDFVCGHEKINQLYHNIIWGQKSNYIDVPTDCPQRDERLGWTGDAQVFVRTAAMNFNVERFFEKWLRDLEAGQLDNGAVGWLVPACNVYDEENVSSAWGDAATICPWEIYMAYGNKRILENQFESMRRWVDYIRNFGDEEYLWIGGKQYGDWLGLDGKEDSFYGATAFDYISSAFYARSTDIFIKAGTCLGIDMKEYEELYKNIVRAFKMRFTKDGVPTEKTQTAYAIALYFDLCDDKEKTAESLANLIKNNGMRLTTGFVGTPYLLHALSENGYVDVAYELLLQEKFPSWLFSVNQGATTMWEHWDGIKEDGTFWDSGMNSFNHYAYGAVYDWIFGVAAGIKILPDGAGYKHIEIKPIPERRIGFLKSKLKINNGVLSSYWYYSGNKVNFEFEVPEGTIAEIILPNGKCEVVSGKNVSFSILAE